MRRLWLLILITAILRLAFLGSYPRALSNDELDLAYSAYSIAKTGRDLSGKFLPFSFDLDASFPPVAVYLIAFFLLFLPLSPFSVRLPFALAGISTVVIVYYLAKLFFRSEKTAFFAALVLSLSPWHLHTSRVGFDTGLAIFFYLLALYLFFKYDRHLLGALLPLGLAFHSYQGTRLIFPFLVFLLIIFRKEFFLKNKKIFFLFLVGLLLIITPLFLSLRGFGTQQRIGQLIFLADLGQATKTVNWEREKTLAPLNLSTFFSNKLTYFYRRIRDQYLYSLSTVFLFTSGEGDGLYSPWFRGQFYTIDFFFLLAGLIFLFLKKNRYRCLLIALVLIAPLPSALSGGKLTYATRSIFLLPLLAMMIGLGLNFSIELLKKQKNSWIGFTLLFLAYFLALTGYLYQYYFSYPVYAGENWFWTDTKLVRLLHQESQKREKIVIAQPNLLLFIRYAFYHQIEPAEFQKIYRVDGLIRLKNIEAVQKCLPLDKEELGNLLPPNSLYIAPEACPKAEKSYLTLTAINEPLQTIYTLYQTEAKESHR